MYCHGLASPSVSDRQQSRLCTAMSKQHPQSQADCSPDCVLPWPNITISLRQTAVQTVYCHGLCNLASLASSSVSVQTLPWPNRLCQADSSPDCVLPWHHPQSQADCSPDCVLPWPNITLSLRQTAVQTVYCHVQAALSQADCSPDCVLPWPNISADSSPDCVLSWPRSSSVSVQTVYCHGLITLSLRLQTVYCHGTLQAQTDSSPDCVLPWPNITLSVQTVYCHGLTPPAVSVQTVYCHGLASPSVSGRLQSRLCTAMA